MWLVINREYVEDPVYLTLVPEPVFSARRTTMLVFFDRGAERGVERLTVSRYGLEGLYQGAWTGGTDEAQWKRLADIVRERDPRRIGIDVSRRWPFGDGLTAGLRDQLLEALGPELAGAHHQRRHAVRALARDAHATRTDGLPAGRRARARCHRRGLLRARHHARRDDDGRRRVVHPAALHGPRAAGVVHAERGPAAQGARVHGRSAFCAGSGVIQRGDVLHTDAGIKYLRLNTDTQEMGYVLQLGEEDVPAGLTGSAGRGQPLAGPADVRVQERAARATRSSRPWTRRPGAKACDTAPTRTRSGSTATRPARRSACGTTRATCPVTGEWKLAASTAYAIEGNVKVAVPEWGGQLVQIKLEQTRAVRRRARGVRRGPPDDVARGAVGIGERRRCAVTGYRLSAIGKNSVCTACAGACDTSGRLVSRYAGTRRVMAAAEASSPRARKRALSAEASTVR